MAPRKTQASDPVSRLLDDEAVLSDGDLGLGEDEAPDALSALLSNPESSAALTKLIDAAVEQRIAQMAPQSALPAGENSEAFKAFIATIEKMLELNAIQQPGYQKPIPPADLERRSAGYVEMMALLKEYRAAGTPPHYYVGPSLFYVDCELIGEGEAIGTFQPPVEDFDPINEPAFKVMAAMMQWIGGSTPDIGSQIAGAMAERRQTGPRVVGEGMKDPSGRSGDTVRLDVKRREIVRPPAFAHMGETVMPSGQQNRDPRTEASEPAVGPVFA